LWDRRFRQRFRLSAQPHVVREVGAGFEKVVAPGMRMNAFGDAGVLPGHKGNI